MQTESVPTFKPTILESTLSVQVNHARAQREANRYLHSNVGHSFRATEGTHIALANPVWQFAIHFRPAGSQTFFTMGMIDVDAQSGHAIPLDAMQIRSIQERADAITKHHPPLNDDFTPNGVTLSAEQARRKANGYLTDYVGLFIKADSKPLLIHASPPLWRTTAILRLRGYGKIAAVGFVDVNAQTGEVISLTTEQISEMKGRAKDAATSLKLSAATPS